MHPWIPPQVLAVVESVTNLDFYCDAPPEMLHFLSKRDLDGPTKDVLRRTKASRCPLG